MKSEVRALDTILSSFKREKVKLFLLCSLNVIIAMLPPLFLQNIIDILIGGENIDLFIRLSLLYGGVIIVDFFIEWLQGYQWQKFGKLCSATLRKSIFGSLLNKPLMYFANNSVSDIVNRLLNDTEIYAQNAAYETLMLLLNILRIVIALIFMTILDMRLVLVVIVFIPIYLIFYRRLNAYLRHSARKEREAYSDMLENAQEKVTGIETIRFYGKEVFFLNKFSHAPPVSG